MKTLKDDHSPIDSGIFAVINSSIFGVIFSLSMFNKNFEPYSYGFKDKLYFTGRNVIVLSTMHGLNQFFIKFLKLPNVNNFLQSFINNSLVIKFILSFLSTLFPAYLSYKIYFYKNKHILIDKKYFLGMALTFFIFDFAAYNK